MTNIIVLYVLSAIAVEAISEIITSSDLTFGFRSWLNRLAFPDVPHGVSSLDKSNSAITRLISLIEFIALRISAWFYKLISCGYCTSVWVAAGISIALPKPVEGILGWVLCVFVVHRASNLIHVIYELIKKGRVKTFDIMYQKNGEADGSF
jgi:hypothetical protein